MSLHVDISQLVYVVLHRQLRQRVYQHFLIVVGLVLLVVAVVVGEHWEEQVALDIEIGEGILVEHLGVFPRGHVLLYGVVLLVGFHVHEGIAVEWRHLEDEMAAVLCLLHRANKLSVPAHFCLNKHLVLQVAVVHAYVLVGISYGAILYGFQRCVVVGGGFVGCRYESVALRLFGPGVHVVGLAVTPHLCHHAHAVLPFTHLVGLHLVYA